MKNDNTKLAILFGLSAFLAYLVFTKSGKSLAQKAGEYIMNLSENAIDVIRRFEGFSDKPYPDAQGYSIGYGHFIKPGEKFTTLTEAQARALLRDDAGIAAATVKNSVTVPLTQNQFDALTSLVYNIGATAFRNSTLLKKLNAGDYSAAAQQFDVWNKATVPGMGKIVVSALVQRRADEKELFLTA